MKPTHSRRSAVRFAALRKFRPLLLAAGALGVCSAPAARAENFVTRSIIQDDNPATNDFARANTNINAVPIKRNALTTVGDYQFTSYYQQDGKIAIGRRRTGQSTWDIFRTEFTAYNINDDHDISSIGIDGDGIFHMSWGMHSNNFLYTKSTSSVLNSNPINLIGGSVGNAAAPNSMTGLYNTAVTYPDFYNLPDGDLLFAYRNGASGSGDYRMRRYDTATDSWSELGAGANDIWIGKNAPGSTSPDVNAYPNELAFGPNGEMHATWTWRTGGDTTTGEPGFQTNHNINYARSNDYGATWTNMAGVPYTTPIYESNAEVAINLPEGSSLINTTAMAVDKLGQPVLATWYAPGAPQGDHARQYMFAWYDQSQSQWKTSQISHRTIDGPEKTTEAVVRDMARPIVVIDDANRAIVAYRDNQDANGLTIAYSVSPQRNDWQTFDLTTEDLGNWEPTYDVNRWREDRVLSFLYQPSGLGQTGSPIEVLDWDSNAFFADLTAPKLHLVVDRSTGLATIRNATGETVAVDGYSISSAAGSLNPAGWSSLADQSRPGWQEANHLATRLSELNPFNSLQLNNAATATLGQAMATNAASLAQAIQSSDLKFEYTTAAGTRNGVVEYVGYNNIVMFVNPLTGEATVRNMSNFDVAIDGYTISSADGSLEPGVGDWLSLDDQNASGGQWFEANASATRVSELLMSGAMAFNKHAAFKLGALFDPNGATDLSFQFLLAGDSTPLSGEVVYQIPGDFDMNGSVNAADLAIWRGAFGVTNAADANGDGVSDGADFVVWQRHYGQTWTPAAAIAQTAVPEPATAALASLALVALAVRRKSF
ncbi:BNR-4 repeat-containing protein [Lacipirellula parvula]|nr:BNR-4 repeat-containing protein [Lacipirellula parvula]